MPFSRLIVGVGRTSGDGGFTLNVDSSITGVPLIVPTPPTCTVSRCTTVLSFAMTGRVPKEYIDFPTARSSVGLKVWVSTPSTQVPVSGTVVSPMAQEAQGVVPGLCRGGH